VVIADRRPNRRVADRKSTTSTEDSAGDGAVDAEQPLQARSVRMAHHVRTVSLCGLTAADRRESIEPGPEEHEQKGGVIERGQRHGRHEQAAPQRVSPSRFEPRV